MTDQSTMKSESKDGAAEVVVPQVRFPQPEGHHLASLNIAMAVADLEDPVMADFVNALDAVNGIADRSPGFVWRLKDDSGRGDAARASPHMRDPRLTATLAVWETAVDLEFFAWNTVHRRFMKNRHRWFVSPDKPYLVMWWVPSGTVPDIDDAFNRLTRLQDHGPSELGFGWSNLAGQRIWETSGPPPG